MDAERFTALLAGARRAIVGGRPDDAAAALHEARALWRGPPLLEVRDTELGRTAASRLQDAYIAATEDLAEAELAAGRPDGAAGCLQEHLAAHPLRERGWEHLMVALYRLGRQADALDAYRRARRVLRDELGIEPNPALRRLERRILAQDPGLDHVPAGDANPTRHNLPAALTPLVGRADQLAGLTAELASTRLLTLTGVAGVGKTRLALQLAANELDRFDAVRLVELAPLERDGRVDAQVARALGVSTVPDGGLPDRFAELLAARRVLIVLDNCEHVLAAAAQIAQVLLQRCPSVTVLATSREPLAVAGEAVRAVPTLSLPAADASTPADLAGSDAVALFLQRARASQAGFGLTTGNAPAVRQICRRLDGIPLALELAASRLRALAAQQVADRLDDRFDLLTAGGRTAPKRQQTLRATMDWSYQLLAPEEQAALRALSVFPADFDLDAAATVIGPICGGQGDEVVFRLVDKSLVVTRRRDGSVRYGLLDTIRGYAAERLAETGEGDAARRRHREHYCRLVAQGRPFTPPTSWHCTPAMDEENLRAAAATALADRDGDAALLIVRYLWVIWIMTGRVDSLSLLEQALALDGTDQVARADTLVGLAFLQSWWEAGPVERSAKLFAQARALADQADDDACRYRTLFLHGEFLAQRGDRSGAVAAYRQALDTVPESRSVGCHHSLGWIAWAQGDTAAAKAEFELTVVHGAGTPSEWYVTHARCALAVLTATTGEHGTATSLAVEAVQTARRIGLPALLIVALLRAAQTHLLCDDDAAARTALGELFTLLHRLGTRQFRAEAMEAAALMAHRMGDDRRVAHYLRTAGAIRVARAEVAGGVEVLGSALEQARDAAGAGLDDEQPAALGSARSGEAVAEARAWLAADVAAPVGTTAVRVGDDSRA